MKQLIEQSRSVAEVASIRQIRRINGGVQKNQHLLWYRLYGMTIKQQNSLFHQNPCEKSEYFIQSHVINF